MRTGYVTGRPQLGVRGESVDPFDVQRYGVPEGAYIYSVDEGSAAEKAGIQQGDIITKFGGKEIASFADLAAAKAEHKAGDVVEAEIYRYDARFPETLTVSVTLDEEKPEEAQPQPDNAFPWSVPGGEFGAAS
jgi:serine protease Do